MWLWFPMKEFIICSIIMIKFSPFLLFEAGSLLDQS